MFAGVRRSIDFAIGKHRLSNVPLVSLGQSVDAAIAIYGEPREVKQSEETEDIVEYEFDYGSYHEVIVSVWKDRISSVVYWSAKSDPGRDLEYVLTGYRENHEWNVMEEGYWYQRSDGAVRLWCSAIPAIGIGTVGFLEAKADAKSAKEVAELVTIEDPHWASDRAIFEAQERFRNGDEELLRRFAQRSEEIVLIPDGSLVLIVRRHQAHPTETGFRELNCAPDPADHESVLVINRFIAGHGSCRVVLPMDADLERIWIEGDRCRMILKKVPGATAPLKVSVPLSELSSLSGGSFGPYSNENLWQALERWIQAPSD